MKYPAGLPRVCAVSACARTAIFLVQRFASGISGFGLFWFAVASLLAASLPAAEKWEPIPPADLAAKDSASSPGADAEYLFWRDTLTDDPEGTDFRYQVRAKIYTARGVANAGMLHIDHAVETRLKRLAARVVKPDGSSVELTKTDFIEATLAKQGNIRWLRTSFAFPGLAPGDIVEYRWREETRYGYPTGWWYCQQSVPVREYTFDVTAGFARMNLSWFHVPPPEKKNEDDSQLSITLRNLPAFVEEPQMPPEREVRGWIRLMYTGDEKDPGKAWQNFCDEAGDFFDRQTKPNSAIRTKAAQLVASAATAEEKLRRLYQFCQDEIINLDWSDAPAAREERLREKPRDFQSAKETLARGRGRVNEIDYLFASLARAAGLEPHRAMNATRDELLNARIAQGWEFMDSLTIACKLGDSWRFFSPGDAFVPFGVCHRYDEDAAALIVAGKESILQTIPPADVKHSQVLRRARLALDTEGALTGDVELTYLGHEATTQRRAAWDKAQAEIDRDLADAVKKRLPGAEVSAVLWENLRTGTGPVVARYTVNIPGYAEVAGQRLVVAPGYFVRGMPALFTAAERRYPLMWLNAWQEHDDIEIALPAGFTLEQGTAPANVAEPDGVLTVKYSLGYSTRRHTLIYKRDFSFGAGHHLLFPKENYPVFKSLFEDLNHSDTHSVVLRPQPSPAPSSTSSAVGKAAGT